jgi:hypothetical protein
MVVWRCDDGEVGELRNHVCVSAWARSVRAAHDRWLVERVGYYITGAAIVPPFTFTKGTLDLPTIR